VDVDAVQDQVVRHHTEIALFGAPLAEVHQSPRVLHLRRRGDLEPDQSIPAGAKRRADRSIASGVDDPGHGPGILWPHTQTFTWEAGYVGGADGDPLVAIALGG